MPENKLVKNIVFPVLPYTKEVDPMWVDEYHIAKTHGYNVALYNSDEKKLYHRDEQENFVATPSSKYHERLHGKSIYRGWMLTKAEYKQMAEMINAVVSTDEYLSSHLCYGWVDDIFQYTFPTYYMNAPLTNLSFDKGEKYFIKGASKSFGKLSYVNSKEDVVELLTSESIQDDTILCIRTYIELADEPEDRFFVACGIAVGFNGKQLPESLVPALKQLKQRQFYTLDVAYLKDGTPIIVEIGDGQVSDLKEWDVEYLYEHVINRIEIPSNAFDDVFLII